MTCVLFICCVLRVQVFTDVMLKDLVARYSPDTHMAALIYANAKLGHTPLGRVLPSMQLSWNVLRGNAATELDREIVRLQQMNAVAGKGKVCCGVCCCNVLFAGNILQFDGRQLLCFENGTHTFGFETDACSRAQSN